MIRAPNSAVLVLTAAASFAALLVIAASADQKSSDRPALPYGFIKLDPVATEAYDSKAEPVARVVTALDLTYRRGWETIEKYFPELGIPAEREIPINPSDASDHRFAAQLATEDPGRSPTALVMMICSLDPSAVSGKLKSLRDELVDATNLPDYSMWTLHDLRHATDALTQERTNFAGVKYRAPRAGLSYKQAMQLYAMTVALIRNDTKWKEWEQAMNRQGYSNLDLPDMQDFSNRLPLRLEDGKDAALLLYRPGYLSQPLQKGEFEERADVVFIARKANTFTVEQFPVYLTADQAEWNPAWILPKDEIKDTTLVARKFEYDWTRFDGPFLWYQRDQFNARVVYRCTARFSGEGIFIEAERFVSPRGEVKKVIRNRTYDPRSIRPFDPATDSRMDPLGVDWPDIDSSTASLSKRPSRIEDAFYYVGHRQFLVYQSGPNSFSSSLYPPQTTAAREGTPPVATDRQTLQAASPAAALPAPTVSADSFRAQPDTKTPH